MRVGFDDALTLLGTWKSDGTLLRCDLRFRACAAAFRVRVTDVEPDRLAFMADDREAELVFPLRPEFVFAYGDMRDAPLEAAIFERMLAVFLWDVPEHPDAADSIVFTEVNAFQS